MVKGNEVAIVSEFLAKSSLPREIKFKVVRYLGASRNLAEYREEATRILRQFGFSW